jgi:membrane-associated phospholipid phosphatase
MNIDQSILNFFVGHRVEWLTTIMLVITYAGSYMIVISLTLLSAISFYIHKHYIKILPLFISVGGAVVTTAILKIIVGRGRPPLADMLYLETDPSFPSGHATAAIALYGFLIYAIWSYSAKAPRDKSYFIYFTTCLFSVLIVLVGISRLYLGVHYLSDVLAGYVVGLIWILIGFGADRKIRKLLSWKPKI